jgi:hypothetical protein
MADTEDHCCICRKVWIKGAKSECNCSEIKIRLNEIVSEFISNIDRTKEPSLDLILREYIISPCLECKPMQRFIDGLREMGITDIMEFLRDKSNYNILWHGTPTLEGAKGILEKGYDVDKRGNETGSVFGKAEYFAIKFEVSKRMYAEKQGLNIGKGYVLLNLAIARRILNTKPDGTPRLTPERRLIYQDEPSPNTGDRGERYHVIFNPPDNKASYVLPLGLVPLSGDKHNFLPPTAPPMPKFVPGAVSSAGTPQFGIAVKDLLEAIDKGKIGWEEKAGDIRPYNKYLLEEIRQNVLAGNPIFTYREDRYPLPTRHTYKIDLERMEQQNLDPTSMKIRRIMIIP